MSTEIAKTNGQAQPPIRIADLNKNIAEMKDRAGLNTILSTQPPKDWVKENNGIKYIPIERIENLLRTLFGYFEIKVNGFSLVANSVCVHVTLKVRDPLIEGGFISQDGLGAMPLQTDKGASATDFSKIKNNAVQLALPAAESYAIKDAAEKLGELFGASIGRKDQLGFRSAYELPGAPVITFTQHELLEAIAVLDQYEVEEAQDKLNKMNINAEQRASLQKSIDKRSK
jgi:hypothetical protein